MNLIRSTVTSLVLACLAFGCTFYHNTAAKYNAYFLAKQRLSESEQNLYLGPDKDYNDILQVLAPIDTNQSKNEKTNFDYVLTKGSLPIQFHKTSKWTPLCYLLIGKVRLYQGDFYNAANTFRYINAQKAYPDARHAALIMLMRTYLETGEEDNFIYVREFLRKETAPFSEENTKDFHLLMAHYYRLKQDYYMATRHLELALPLMKPKKTQARYYFLLGQLYHELDSGAKAYESYAAVLKSKPTYNLAFHARLLKSGVEEFTVAKDTLYAERFYRKLLRDGKNAEFRDRTYYEMAKFQVKNGHTDKALALLNESVHISTANVTQKSYSYLKAAKIYFEQKADYERAALYYDSATKIMPNRAAQYEQTFAFNQTMQAFLKEFRTVKAQNRLLLLANMPADQQKAFLEKEIEAEKEEILKNEENKKINEAKRSENMATINAANNPQAAAAQAAAPDASTWYFYNTVAMAQGKSNFVRQWGTRPLEDNWRRSSKTTMGNTQTNATADNNNPSNTRGNTLNGGNNAVAVDIFAAVRSLDERLQEVPQTAVDIAQAETTLQKALFEMGKIYYYQMKETGPAIAAIDSLVVRFPKSELAPEALYNLCLICREQPTECVEDTYKKLLVNNYPESYYAKITVNPNYVFESNTANKTASQQYERAFALYKANNFASAKNTFDQLLGSYPTSDVADKAAYMSAQCILYGSNDLVAYYVSLTKFTMAYPESSLKQSALEKIAKIPDYVKELGNAELNGGPNK